MKIVEIEYSRTFNLGDYESERIALRAEITEVESVEQVYLRLNEDVVKLHLLEHKFREAKKEEPVKAENPKPEKVTRHIKIRKTDLEDNIHPEIVDMLTITLDVDGFVSEVQFKKFVDKQDWVDVNTFLTQNDFRWVKKGKKGSWIL